MRADQRGHDELARKIDDPGASDGPRLDFLGRADGDGLRQRVAAVDGDNRAADQSQIHARLPSRRACDGERERPAESAHQHVSLCPPRPTGA
jgi:hypothetical protein